MTEIELFFAFLCGWMLWGAVVNVWAIDMTFNWWFVKGIQNCLLVFEQQIKLKQLPLILKSHRLKCLVGIGCYVLVGILTWIAALSAWLLLAEKTQILFVIGNILWVIVLLVLLFGDYFFTRKFLKELKILGVYANQDAILIWKDYQQNFSSILKINKIELCKNQKPVFWNRPLNFHQKRFLKKIKKLKTKNYSLDKYQIKLLKIYLAYIREYSYMFKRIEGESAYYVAAYSALVNKKEYLGLDSLKFILINNFFAFVQA